MIHPLSYNTAFRGKHRMNIRVLAMTTAAVALSSALAAAAAPSGVSLNAARVGAVDVAADEKFYEAAFGLHEVRRFEFPGGVEVLMNFGSTADAAKANSAPQIVIMQRK